MNNWLISGLILALLIIPIANAQLTANEITDKTVCDFNYCCSDLTIMNYNATTLNKFEASKTADMVTKVGIINFVNVTKLKTGQIRVCGYIRELHNYWGIKDLWDSTWWNATCNNKQNISIQYTGTNATLYDYQVLINVTSNANMTDNGNWVRDLYFANQSDGVKIPYWNMTQTTSYADIWLKVPRISNSVNTTVDMYYNCSASSTPNGKDVFLLFDDFDDASLNTTLWATSLGAEWSTSESNGRLSIIHTASGGITSFAFRSQEVFTIGKKAVFEMNATNDECSLTGVNNDGSGNIGFLNGTSSTIGHYAGISHSDTEPPQICKIKNNDGTQANTFVNWNWKTDQIYQVYWNTSKTTGFNQTVNYMGNNASCIPTENLPTGMTGDENRGSNTYYFYFWAVGLFVDKEPVHSFGGVEQYCTSNYTLNSSENICYNTTHYAYNTTYYDNHECEEPPWIINYTYYPLEMLGYTLIDTENNCFNSSNYNQTKTYVDELACGYVYNTTYPFLPYGLNSSTNLCFNDTHLNIFYNYTDILDCGYTIENYTETFCANNCSLILNACNEYALWNLTLPSSYCINNNIGLLYYYIPEGEHIAYSVMKNCTHGCDDLFNRCRDSPLLELGEIIGIIMLIIGITVLFFKKVFR